MKKIAVSVFIVFLIAMLVSGCGSRKKRETQEAIPVRAMKVEPMDLSRVLEYVGSIKAQDEAIVYPKVSGKIIEQVKEEGSPVTKGEVIAYIDRDEIGLQFEKAPVESPLTGIVGRVYVDIGSNVTPQTPVALVADMKEIITELGIPEKYLPDISLGQRAVITVDAYPGREFSGKVTKISPVLDVETRAAPIEITIDDEKRELQSGMFAKVKLIIEEHKGVPVILKEAIIGKEPDTYVYVAEGGRAHMRKVTLGIHQGPNFEIREGVKAGDLVVIMGQQRLRDKVPVRVEVE
jgi:multidrug efflux pump subunit AcrA (membrane-fusion protein)